MRYILFFLLFLSPIYVCSQDKTLTKSIKKYIKAVNAYDLEKMYDFMPDFVFIEKTREEAVIETKALMDTIKDEITIDLSKKFRIDTLLVTDSMSYARIVIPIYCTMDLSDTKGEGGMGYAFKLLVSSFQEKYGEENVQVDYEKRKVSYNNEEPTYAIKIGKDWKFIELHELSKKYIPAQIRHTKN